MVAGGYQGPLAVGAEKLYCSIVNRNAILRAWGAGVALAAAGVGCHESTGPNGAIPTPRFVVVRRAWLPGERDALITRLARDSLDGVTFSAAVAQFLAGSDSATVVVPNPALAAAAAGPGPPLLGLRLGQAGQAWVMVGFQLREVYPISPGSPTLDSITWLGVLWYASPESTWKGRVVAATAATTIGRTTVNTAAFDASFGTSGAGGGEARASTGQYWEAASGQIRINNYQCYPAGCADQSFVSGPWQGGLWHGIQIQGNLIGIVAPCILPAGCTAPPDTFDVGFTGAKLDGVAVNCVFPSPCTGPAAAVVAALRGRTVPLGRPAGEAARDP
jgi:hypothetical protein